MIRAFVFFIVLSTSLLYSEGVQLMHTEEQKETWRKLYSKLNSKMARMEEVLNYVERFMDEENFKEEVLLSLAEFTFLSNEALEQIPAYLDTEERPPYSNALKLTASYGGQLYLAIDQSNSQGADQALLSLRRIRRISHAKWAE